MFLCNKTNSKIQITSKCLFDWAVNCFKNVSSEFCTSEEHQAHENLYQSQHQTSKTIPKNRQFHAFVPKDKKQFLCKIFFSSEETVIFDI